MLELVPEPDGEVELEVPLRDLLLLALSCAQAMLAANAVVKQSANALRIDRFMFTLLANFCETRGIIQHRRASRLRHRNIMRSVLRASARAVFYSLKSRNHPPGAARSETSDFSDRSPLHLLTIEHVRSDERTRPLP